MSSTTPLPPFFTSADSSNMAQHHNGGEAPSMTSSSLLMTPPASPSTVQRRMKEAVCLEPPSLKRKRDDDYLGMPLPPSKDLDARYFDFQSRNKRRMMSFSSHSRRNNHHPKHPSQSPLPMLSVADFTGAPTMPNTTAAPTLSLRPRTESSDLGKESFINDDIAEEQDENDPPQDEVAAKTLAILEAALSVSSSTASNTNGEHEDCTAAAASALFASPTVPPKSIKAPLERSSSVGSAILSTPLPVARALSSSNSFLTLSLSKRRLSFGSSNITSHQHPPKNSDSYQTPLSSTTTLVQGLEGLCLPSLEDVEYFTNEDGAGRAVATTTRALQQKRPPSTPHQGNATQGTANNRSAASTTFDYLATALRLPDVAFSSKSM